MDTFSHPPDIASLYGGDEAAADEQSPQAPSSSSVHPLNPFAHQLGHAGAGNMTGAAPAGPQSGTPGSDNHSQPLSLKQQVHQLAPKSFAEAFAAQVAGEKTPKQQEVERGRMAKLQADIQRSQQEWSAYQEKQKAEKGRLVQQLVQTRSQIREVGGVQAATSLGQTTGADESELALLEKILADAVAAKKQREARAKQALLPKSPRKGPTLEGGAERKSDMTAQMMGTERADSSKDDTDSMQRMAEQAMGE